MRWNVRHVQCVSRTELQSENNERMRNGSGIKPTGRSVARDGLACDLMACHVMACDLRACNHLASDQLASDLLAVPASAHGVHE